MTLAVIGLGSIGARHAQTLHKQGHTVFGVDPKTADGVFSSPIPEACPSLSMAADLWEAPTGVLLCTPPATHYQVALEVMTVWPTCRSLFIEKPLANSVIAGRLLLQAAADRGVRVTVGYMLRCLPKLQALRQTLLEGPSAYHVRASFGYDVDQWRASPATYLSPILLEASHEIDLVTWLLGEAPRAISGWEYSLSGDGLLWTSKGTPVSLHLDGLLPTYARRLEVFSLAGRTIWDELEVSATRAVTVDMAYQTELEAWLRDDPMLCTGQEALVTLAVVEAWTQSGRRGGQIVGVIPP